MVQDNQFLDDAKRLSALLERLTGIPAIKTFEHINEFGVDRILSGAGVLCSTNAQRERLKKVFAFKNIYTNLKAANQKKEYVIDSTQKAMKYFINYFSDIADREHLVVTCLDSNYKILSTKIISSGTVNSTTIHAREILKEALFNNAVSVMVSHNHPSGILKTSKEDINTTVQIEKALNLADVSLTDHVIVCGDKAMSMADEGIVGRIPKPETQKAASPVNEKRENYITRDEKPPSIKAFLTQAKTQRSHNAAANIPNRNDRGRG